MIVCSIDLMGGKAVQLQQGERLVLERDDPCALAERFGRLGEIAVIDLDAARGRGDNRKLAEELCRLARVRVGGGIRDAETARAYLRAGAERVIVGTAATPELLSALPRERTIVALDARGGRVAVEGWQTLTDETPLDRAGRLSEHCGGFLWTNVDREGMLAGADIAYAQRLRSVIEDRALTVAGGIASIDEVRELDRLGIDAQLGMAIYTGVFDPVDALCTMADFERGGGLLPTIVCDARDGRVRMLSYSSPQSLAIALREGVGIYFSRSRDRLWRKGETSGDEQRLVRVALDCDRDAVIFYVEQTGSTCHTGADRCFDSAPFTWERLMDRIEARARSGGATSYTRKLLANRQLLGEKIVEEAEEVVSAVTRDEIAWECADLLYFMSVRIREGGVGIEDVMAQLAARAS
jgi:phosphoribosyl-AMP cyclohydrolase / phosphoribosyl-ATP pyrophosphohydrolase